ncbi:hypothetical protein V1478_008683 [Vespula squamosa]|uniref:Uncharacterized protein n=1 Tax=Vespula squamosa TaxID=30214 RepID=A0ABD2AUL2_VESSQ
MLKCQPCQAHDNTRVGLDGTMRRLGGGTSVVYRMDGGSGGSNSIGQGYEDLINYELLSSTNLTITLQSSAKFNSRYEEHQGTKEEYPMPMKIMQFSTSQRKPNFRGNHVTMSSASLENVCFRLQ